MFSASHLSSQARRLVAQGQAASDCRDVHVVRRADLQLLTIRLADPSSLVTKDRDYIYCSNDDESPVEGTYNIPNVICASSNELESR